MASQSCVPLLYFVWIHVLFFLIAKPANAKYFECENDYIQWVVLVSKNNKSINQKLCLALDQHTILVNIALNLIGFWVDF